MADILPRSLIFYLKHYEIMDSLLNSEDGEDLLESNPTKEEILAEAETISEIADKQANTLMDLWEEKVIGVFTDRFDGFRFQRRRRRDAWERAIKIFSRKKRNPNPVEIGIDLEDSIIRTYFWARGGVATEICLRDVLGDIYLYGPDEAKFNSGTVTIGEVKSDSLTYKTTLESLVNMIAESSLKVTRDNLKRVFIDCYGYRF